MTVLHGGRIFDYATGTLDEACDLCFDERRIERIANGSESMGCVFPVDSPITETIDVSGCILLPGFHNAHAHTAMTLFRGLVEDVSIDDWFNKHIWIVEQNLTPEDVYWGTMLGALEMLRSGVTHVSDHYFSMDRAFAAYREAGMRANLAWAMFGIGDDAESDFDRALDFARSFRTEEPLITTSLGPHSPYLCPPDFLRKTAMRAKDENFPLHIHVSETESQVRESVTRTGKTPVDVLAETGILTRRTMLAHAYYATNADLELIRRSGSTVAHCPKTFMKFGFVSDLLPRALRNGVQLALGSDGVASNNTMSILEAARDATLLAKCATGDATVAPVHQISRLMSGGGMLSALPAQTKIAPGDPPDLLVVRIDRPHLVPHRNLAAHLLYSAQESDIEMVFVGGRKVIDRGHHTWIDEEEVYRRVNSIADRLSVHRTDTPMHSF